MMNNCLRNLFFSLLLLSGAVSANEDQNFSKSIYKNVSVTGSMTVEKFQTLLGQGFKSVIINRPDDENGNLVSSEELNQLAKNQKVDLVYQPVISGKMTQKDVEQFAEYYNQLPKPILMVCRSGSRSTQLFNQAKNLGLLNE